MSTLVAILYADVLVPILSCDLLLSAFDKDLDRPVVTATILDETERSLTDGFTHLDSVAMREHVIQVAAALSHHTHDEGDVTAAAIAHCADLVVSNDRACDARSRRGIRRVSVATTWVGDRARPKWTSRSPAPKGEIMLDQQTKQQLKDKFQQIKSQLKQQFPDLKDEDLQKGESDPDQLVKTIALKTGKEEMQVEQTLKQLVQKA